MGFVETNLMPGEKVIYQARLHWKVYWLAFTLGLVAVVMFAVSPEAAVIILVMAAAVALAPLISTKTSQFAVTDRRVLIKVGWIQRRSLEVLLNKVEGIGVDQGLWGRMLGYGTIVVTGTGGTPQRFNNIGNPLEFRRQVQGQIYSGRTRTGAEPEAPPLGAGREERECPYCSELILAKARVCKHCGRDVQPVS